MKTEKEDIISSHRIYAEYAIFESYAMKNKNSLSKIPFTKNTIGDFIYLTNRKFNRYSYLFNELDPTDVYHNTTMAGGYTALIICEKIEYIENTKYDFTELKEKENAKQGDLTGKYCIFQNPLNKLAEYDFHDIIDIYDDYNKAYKQLKYLSSETSVLLARIKAHIDWH